MFSDRPTTRAVLTQMTMAQRQAVLVVHAGETAGDRRDQLQAMPLGTRGVFQCTWNIFTGELRQGKPVVRPVHFTVDAQGNVRRR